MEDITPFAVLKNSYHGRRQKGICSYQCFRRIKEEIRRIDFMYNSANDTHEHINKVLEFIGKLIYALEVRQDGHDMSKLLTPEKTVFDEFTPKLKDCTFGSEEYKDYLAAMKPALDHHYAANRHHPEHFPNGVQSMNLVDLCEMIADWKAASMRHADGDITRSIETNQKRFGYSDELKQILANTVRDYFE
jgi:hypothetical protein